MTRGKYNSFGLIAKNIGRILVVLLVVALLVATTTQARNYQRLYTETKDLPRTYEGLEDTLWNQLVEYRNNIGYPVVKNQLLCDIAFARASENVKAIQYNHSGFHERFEDPEYIKYLNTAYTGENLMMDIRKDKAFQTWIDSPPHKENLDRPSYKDACIKCFDKTCALILSSTR